MSARAIPLGDAPSLRRSRQRTRLERIGLALALVGAGIAAFIYAQTPAASSEPLLNAPSQGVVVIDISASVELAELQQMDAALTRLAATHAHYALVVFSDQAYELLPPGAPATALRQMAYFFHPVKRAAAANGLPVATPSGGVTFNSASPIYPVNPWASGFTLGTQISTGLNLAASIIEAGKVDRTVWLLSDLGDEGTDFPIVSSVAKTYVQEGIRLNVVGLDPSKQDARFFASLATAATGNGTLPARHPGASPRSTQALPLGLAIAVVLLGILLALSELRSTPLRWGVSSLERSA